MNSSQRRKLNRALPHSIKIQAMPGLAYFEHDDKVEIAKKWCKNNAKGVYQVKTFWDKAIFDFSDKGDAVHFALKWL
jgi:hypothetical protein